MPRSLGLSLIAIGLNLAACSAPPLAAPSPEPTTEARRIADVGQNRQLDLLFLIDNSPSMADKQDILARNFPRLIEVLETLPGGLPDVHVGVVSSDLGAGPRPFGENCPRPLGDRGLLLTRGPGKEKAGCGLEAGARFAIALDAGKRTNFTGRLPDVFSCLAQLGDNGCGEEHQLEALHRALTPQLTPENQGFLRPDAILGIVLLTDEDDCSAAADTSLFDGFVDGQAASLRCALQGHLCGGAPVPAGELTAPLASCAANGRGALVAVDRIVRDLRALKKDPARQIFVGAITGKAEDPGRAEYRIGRPKPGADLELQPICSSRAKNAAGQPWKAVPPLRIEAFVNGFENGRLYSICDDDYRAALQDIGANLVAISDPACLDAPLVDRDPKRAGVQPTCVVSETGPDGKEWVLPACDAAPAPCWRLVDDSRCTISGKLLAVDRGQGTTPTPGTQQSVRCEVCATPGDPRCAR